MKPSKEQLKEMVISAIEAKRDEIIQLGNDVFNEPELGFKEVKTAAKVKKAFSELGIGYKDEVAITGVIGKLTGANSKLNVAVMGELDALKVPNHPQANKETGAAHACGHNCMIASLVGVAYGLVDSGVMAYLDGDVSLMAVPAEEGLMLEERKRMTSEGKIKFMGGKQEFIRLGEFDDVDVMIMGHNGVPYPGGILACGSHTNTGFVSKLITYKGQAAHAGVAPHLGVNALNAATIGMTALNFQRETFQEKDTVRVNPIITKGGDLANIVADDVRLEMQLRASNLEAIKDAEIKVDRSFKAGGDAVGAQTIIETLPGYLPLVPCEPLMNVMYENQKAVIGEKFVVPTIGHVTGSTDVGDVSNLMPAIHARFAGLSGTMHSSDVAVDDVEIAYIAPAKALAMTVIDLLYNDAEVGLEIKHNFTPSMTKEEYLRDWGKL